MDNMSQTFVSPVTAPSTSDSKLLDPVIETTADISSLISDQSRIVNEEIEFEVRNEYIFSEIAK